MYVENPIVSTKKLLNLISEFSKVAGYKVNIQKSMAFLYTNNEVSERETRGKIPFSTATRKIKYLGINLTKDIKDRYSENYRTLKKEIVEIQINGSICCVHELEELTIKMAILPKTIYRFNTIPTKIPMTYLTNLEHIFQKCI